MKCLNANANINDKHARIIVTKKKKKLCLLTCLSFLTEIVITFVTSTRVYISVK